MVSSFNHIKEGWRPQEAYMSKRMEYSQVERHRFLIPTFKGSNPFTPKVIFDTPSQTSDKKSERKLLNVRSQGSDILLPLAAHTCP